MLLMQTKRFNISSFFNRKDREVKRKERSI